MNISNKNRGSVLIVAMIFSAILAIALTSYIKLSIGAAQLAHRSFYMNAAQNLVDTGMERALWSLNNEYLYASPSNWTTGGFTARAGFPDEYQGTFPSTSTYYEFAGNVKGQVKVWVQKYVDTSTPSFPDTRWKAIARATMTLSDGSTLTKMAECHLQQRSYSDKGMVARDGMSFNGNVVIDSWDAYSTSTYAPYSTSNRSAEATVASPSLISIQNADIYGWVSIGTSTINSSGITVGANGRVAGTIPGSIGIDTTRVTCDFTASFPDVNPASSGTTLAAITDSTTLTSGTYNTPLIDINGNGKTIEIGATSAADVILTVNGNITLTGGAKLIIYPGSTLTMYVAGDITMTGTSGVQNGTETVPNPPKSFTLLGLRTEAQIVAGALMQDWVVRGTSYLSCVIFAPNADVEVNGTGDTYGSVVGNRVDMVGSGNFHQDLSLGRNKISGLWKLLKWRELYTAADRTLYSTELAF